ncbi:MAG: serine/threonine-protein kinase [Acidobacteriota bacterium]
MQTLDGWTVEGVQLARGAAAARTYSLRRPHSAAPVTARPLRCERPEQRARLLRETRALVDFAHPHVCRTYGVGRLHGRPCLVTERIDGTPLRDAQPTLDLETKIEIMIQIADAVRALHDARIVHHSIMPHSIVLRSGLEASGRAVDAVLVGFGLTCSDASAAGQVLDDDVIAPTAYMAPEQIDAQPRAGDRLSDLYSLGATFYHLVTGRAPFVADTAQRLIERVLVSDVPPPRAFDPVLPEALDALVLRCLARDRALRPADASEIVHALRALVVPRPLMRWLRRALPS